MMAGLMQLANRIGRGRGETGSKFLSDPADLYRIHLISIWLPGVGALV